MERKTILKKILSVFTAGAMSLSLMSGIPFGELSLGITASAASDPTSLTFDVSEGNITIDSGTISYGSGQSRDYTTGAEITITGSTNSNTVTVASGVSANITLAGVNISSDAAAFKIADDSTGNVKLTLKGENTLKSSGNKCAGLQKRGNVEGIGALTISGDGSLTATGGNNGAGIGGGNCSNITINGNAEVTATGGNNGAGIGGEIWGSCSNITISGGTVNASGNSGAGIGGGWGGSGTDITISGGTVIATGGSFSAGIGGGNYGNGTDITISGGTVTAIGKEGGAGIGGGNGGSCTNFTFESGKIIVTRNAEIPSGKSFTIGKNAVLEVKEGVTLTSNGTIQNNGTIINGGTIAGNTVDNKGTISKPFDGKELDVSQGSIVIGKDTITQGTDVYSYTEDQQITITGTTKANTIMVNSGVSANITLKNVNIDVSAIDHAAAFKIADGSTGNVTITLADGTTNTLKSGKFEAGLQKNGTYISDDQGKLTIQGGELGTGILNTTGGIYGAGIGGRPDNSSANITITGGIITATGGEGAAGIGGGSGGGDGTNITISGGTVTAKGGAYGAGIGGGTGGDGTNITITRGTVIAKGGGGGAGIGGGENSNGTNITISGGEVEANGGEHGAGIGGGINGISSDFSFTGGKIIVTRNAEIPSGKSFTIGENAVLEIKKGVTLTNNGTIQNNGTIINNGSITGNPVQGDGAYTSKYDNSELNVSQGSIVIGDGIITQGNKTFTYSGTPAVTITGTTTANTITVEQIVSAKITLKNVNVTVSGSKPAFMIADGSTGNVEITLVGTNVLKSGSQCAGLQKNGDYISEDKGKLTIGGTGSLTATGGYYAAGIGGAKGGSGSNITIIGGTVTAEGNGYGAGIGGANGGSGSYITISDGTVFAKGGSQGAGIGGGGTSSGSPSAIGSNIIISGGEVTATGGTDGAGIGGGKGGNGTDISISGGEVTATGGTNAAGIGGGNGGSGMDITISDGKVTATGGANAAGIGGGIGGGSGNRITISGGEVTATGLYYGAGIGGGSQGGCSDIIINGGSVKAEGGTRAGHTASPIGTGVQRVSGTYTDGTLVTPTDGSGNDVYLFSLDTSGNAVSITTSAGNTYNAPSTHGEDTTICVYLPAGDVDNTNNITLGSGADSVTTNYYYFIDDADSTNNKWVIVKDVDVPTGIESTYGDTLADVELPSDADGHWEWVNDTTSVGNVGEHEFPAVYKFSDSRYAEVTKDIIVTVNRKPITVTADDMSKTYGDSDPEEYTYTFDESQLVSGDTLTGELSRESGDDVKAGGYAITQGTLTNANNPNYAIDFTGAVFTIEPRQINLNSSEYKTQQNVVKGVGTFQEPAYNGVGGEEVTGEITYTYNGNSYTYDEIVEILANLPKGNVETISFIFKPNSNNYSNASGNIILTIIDIDFTVDGQTATVDNAVTIKKNPTYGDSWEDIITLNTELTATLGSNSTTSGFSLAQTGKPDAGEQQEFKIVFSGALGGKEFREVTVASGTVNIAKKAVTITADSFAIKVGDPLPTEYTYKVTGLVNDEELPIDEPTISCDATDSNTAATYDIVVEGDDESENYTFTYKKGTLTITDKNVQTITAEDVTLTYGDTDGKIEVSGNETALTFTVTEGADVISVDQNGIITILNAGTATVEIKAAETNEYAEVTATITVTVNKIKVEVPAKDTTAFTYTGTEQTYTIAKSDLYTVSNNTQINAGSYTVEVTLTEPDHYDWNGTLPVYTFKIEKAAVTVTADSFASKVGDPLPTYTYTVTGLVNNEDLPINPTISCSATDSKTAGTYDIVVEGDDESENYTFTYKKGTLTITDKNVQTITAEDVTLTYGDTNGKISASGNKGALSYNVKSGADVISVDASGNITTLKAGTATVEIKAAETDEYAEAKKTITVTVNKIKVDVPAKDTTAFTYNGKAQTYAIAESDLYTVEGDTQTNAGSYTVTVTLNDTVNHEWNGTLPTYTFVIEKAAVTITADSFTIKVGDKLPTFTYKATGLVNGEELPITPQISCSAKDSKTAGVYDIIVSGADSTNYKFTFVKGKLTISEKPVVAAPEINPNGGTFSGSQEVKITCSTKGAEIYYTTDGTDPTAASTKYEGAFRVAKTTTVKAIAVKNGMENSAVVSAEFTKNTTPSRPGRPSRPSRPTTPTTPTEPRKPIVNGKELSWTDVSNEVKKIPNGGELLVDLNGNTTVPADVIVAIANNDAVITFKLNSEVSFVVDGAKITGNVSAAELAVGASRTTLSATNFSVIGGNSEKQFTLGNVEIPAKMSISLDKTNAGKIASLMKLNSATGKYEFVSAAKTAADGTALVGISGKGDYLLIVDNETKKPGDLNNDMLVSALDAAELLKSIVYELSISSFKADFNGDGKANAMDASEILKAVVGLVSD